MYAVFVMLSKPLAVAACNHGATCKHGTQNPAYLILSLPLLATDSLYNFMKANFTESPLFTATPFTATSQVASFSATRKPEPSSTCQGQRLVQRVSAVTCGVTAR